MADAAYANAYGSALDSTADFRPSQTPPGPQPQQPPETEDFGSLLARKAEAQAGRRGYGLTPELKSRMSPMRGSPYSFTLAKAGPKHVVVVGLHDHRGEVVRHGVFGWQELEDHAATAPHSEFVGRVLGGLRPRTEGKRMANATKYARETYEKDGRVIAVNDLGESTRKLLAKMGWKPAAKGRTETTEDLPFAEEYESPPPSGEVHNEQPAVPPPSSSRVKLQTPRLESRLRELMEKARPLLTKAKSVRLRDILAGATALKTKTSSVYGSLEDRAEKINDYGHRLENYLGNLPGRTFEGVSRLVSRLRPPPKPATVYPPTRPGKTRAEFVEEELNRGKTVADRFADIVRRRNFRHEDNLAGEGILPGRRVGYSLHPELRQQLATPTHTFDDGRKIALRAAKTTKNGESRRYIVAAVHDTDGQLKHYGVFGLKELRDIAANGHDWLTPHLDRLATKPTVDVAKYSRQPTLLDI